MNDTFREWVHYAEQRYEARLMDGRICTLMAVRRAPRSCKVKLYNRHYECWVEDIAMLRNPTTSSGEPGPWFLLDAWHVVDLSKRPGTQVRSLRAVPSKRWLEVIPRPEVLHPSFGQSQEYRTRPPVRPT